MAISRADRAKQFLPFDALSGLNEALREKEIEYEEKIELADDGLKELEDEFNKIMLGDKIKVKYFKDARYICSSGEVTKIDYLKKIIQLNGKENILIYNILKIERQLNVNFL